MNTSVIDIDEITPMERKMLIKYIIEDLQQQKAAIEKATKSSQG